MTEQSVSGSMACNDGVADRGMRHSSVSGSGCCHSGWGSAWKLRARRSGDGWRRFRRCWASRSPCVVFGISGGRGKARPRRSLRRRTLVVVGFYRYVRNPMYVGFAFGWIGLWIVFGHANPVAIASVAAVALGVHLFVLFYEEPTCERSSARTTLSIAETYDAGCRACRLEPCRY